MSPTMVKNFTRRVVGHLGNTRIASSPRWPGWTRFAGYTDGKEECDGQRYQQRTQKLDNCGVEHGYKRLIVDVAEWPV